MKIIITVPETKEKFILADERTARSLFHQLVIQHGLGNVRVKGLS
jgi:hypothetical protein